MKEKNNYYVYVYIRKDTKDVFYIGKGKGRRDKNVDNHNEYCKNVANKYGVEIKRIKENLTEDEAFQLEKETIDYYVNCLGYSIALDGKRIRYEKHFLCNHTMGGEGSSGYIHSEEQRQKARERFLGDNNVAKRTDVRKKLSEHAKNNNSFSLPYVKEKIKEKKQAYYADPKVKEKLSQRMKVFYNTEAGKEMRERLIESRKGCTPINAIKIYCITDGKVYNSIAEFSKNYKPIKRLKSDLFENNKVIELMKNNQKILVSICPFDELTKEDIENPYRIVDLRKENNRKGGNNFEIYCVEEDIKYNSISEFCRTHEIRRIHGLGKMLSEKDAIKVKIKDHSLTIIKFPFEK